MKYPVVLASSSPRRQELLRRLVPEFTVDPANIDEESLSVSDPFVTARDLAREKALVVFARHPEALVIAGDTVVALETETGWKQLAKPQDLDEARSTLTQLQGRSHVVITGIALRWPKGLHAFTDHSTVTFRHVSQEEIEAYLATGDSMDKAGAYGLQGEVRKWLDRIEGHSETVIGLPVQALEEALKSVS